MIRQFSFVTLIIVLASPVARGLPSADSDFAMASSAVLPPLPDLPIPGSKTKVMGNQSIEAAQARKEERTIQDTPATVEPTPDSSSSPIVFKTDRAQQLVF